MTDVLERQQSSPTIGQEEIPTETLRRLLESQADDLPMVGLCVLSLRPEAPGRPAEEAAIERIAPFVDNPTSARNVARYLIGELSLSTARRIAHDSAVATETLARAFAELESDLARPSPSAAPAPQTRDMTIIVHGTWAASSTWWQPGGNFWTYLDGIVGNVYGGPDYFSWSGAHRHSARVAAANDLLGWARSHPVENLDVIAHSHGGNVCLLASRLGLGIRKLILLGNPVRLEYIPELENIATIENVFSTGDKVQTPPATIPNRRAEGRTFGDSSAIANHRAVDDGSGNDPGHSELHEPATWSASGLDALLL